MKECNKENNNTVIVFFAVWFVKLIFFQTNVESEIVKLKDKIAKTREQLNQICPKYDAERRNEEQAASQLVNFVYV